MSIFVIAFSLRAFMLTKVPERWVYPHTRWETHAIAMSLYENGTFADPYAVPTGPTAHAPPLYPAWMSLLYRIFGTSLRAGYIRWLFDLAFDSAILAMLPWLARRFGLGISAGLCGGLAAAVLPRCPTPVESLAAIAMALILVAFAGRWSRGGASGTSSLLLGVACGISFHIKPALLPVVLGCLVFELVFLKRRRSRTAAALILAGILVAIAPWTWRNWTVFHELYFIRSNLGLEMRIGNHEGAHPDVDVSDERHELRHPRTNVEEARRLRDLGEAAYMKETKREALRWIRGNPLEYAKLVGGRTLLFWTGPVYEPFVGILCLALLAMAAFGGWVSIPPLAASQRAVIVIPLITFPLVYYVVSWMPRYRLPVEWLLLLLAGAGLCQLVSRGQAVRSEA
jgi:hypothetical protein